MLDEIEILREAVQVTRARRPFAIDAWVVLPDHMHAVWTLPEGDANYSDRWGAIKARFSKRVRLKEGGAVGCKPTLPVGRRVGLQPTDAERLRAGRTPSKVAKQDAGIWQRRFWEHHIRDEADYAAHVRYCWGNPVKHGFVERAADWPYSSFHRDVRMGRVDPEFVGTVEVGAFGEVA
nr:transposase [Antarctobacter sp.]